MIRSYRPEDLERVMDIWYRASKVGHPFLSEEALALDRAEIIALSIPVARQLVWEEDGEVVGFIALVENHVGGLFVLPSYHRRGIGTRLMRHVQEMYARLTVDVYVVNENARRFYEKCGFRSLRERVCSRTGQPEFRLEWSAPAASE